MAVGSNTMSVYEIGETAGQIWKVLEDGGPMSIARLTKAVDAPRDTVLMALGWLAREDKITVDQSGRSRTVALR